MPLLARLTFQTGKTSSAGGGPLKRKLGAFMSVWHLMDTGARGYFLSFSMIYQQFLTLDKWHFLTYSNNCEYLTRLSNAF